MSRLPTRKAAGAAVARAALLAASASAKGRRNAAANCSAGTGPAATLNLAQALHAYDKDGHEATRRSRRPG